jgi:hypothetical protein
MKYFVVLLNWKWYFHHYIFCCFSLHFNTLGLTTPTYLMLPPSIVSRFYAGCLCGPNMRMFLLPATPLQWQIRPNSKAFN